MRRPSVSVIVPFAGEAPELDATLKALDALELRGDDELFLSDNRPTATPHSDPRVIPAPGPASSYFARGVAATRAHGDWLVFLDADTHPEPDLLDAYFEPTPKAKTAVLAGAIEDWVDEDTRVARYIATRKKLDQATTLAHHQRPYAQTANCAIRREAFEAVGGFPDPVRSGGDADVCWRLLDAGWQIEERPSATVRHRNRTTLTALLGQLHRHGSGMQWLDRRYPGTFPPPGPRELAGRMKLLARGSDGALDFLSLWARDLGRLKANGDPTRPSNSRP